MFKYQIKENVEVFFRFIQMYFWIIFFCYIKNKLKIKTVTETNFVKFILWKSHLNASLDIYETLRVKWHKQRPLLLTSAVFLE